MSREGSLLRDQGPPFQVWRAMKYRRSGRHRFGRPSIENRRRALRVGLMTSQASRTRKSTNNCPPGVIASLTTPRQMGIQLVNATIATKARMPKTYAVDLYLLSPPD